MKLEPLKKAKLPKYAAVFAVLTVFAAMLTGCGEPALGGDVAVPVETEAAPQTESVAEEVPQ